MEKTKFTSVDDYLLQFDEEKRAALGQIRRRILEAFPELEEAISYQIPTMRWKGKNVVHFAAFTNHIGFYPAPTAAAAFLDELSGYKQGKGSVQFPLDKPIPYDLITRITRYRMEEMENKFSKNNKRKT